LSNHFALLIALLHYDHCERAMQGVSYTGGGCTGIPSITLAQQLRNCCI